MTASTKDLMIAASRAAAHPAYTAARVTLLGYENTRAMLPGLTDREFAMLMLCKVPRTLEEVEKITQYVGSDEVRGFLQRVFKIGGENA